MSKAIRLEDLPLFAPDDDIALAVCGKNAAQWPSIAPLLEREGLPTIDPLFGGRYGAGVDPIGFTLFVDMDGVLADFDAGYEQRFGVRSCKEADNVDWALVRRTPGFYRDLPPMPDFDELWNGIARYRPIILTGVPRSVEEAPANKREWVDRVIGKDQPMIACASKDKSLHMRAPGDVLIDDWEKYRHIWIGRGGRWITHTSARASIAALNIFATLPTPEPSHD